MNDTPKKAAEFIYNRLSEEEREYANSEERGKYRGFAALHDIMDANELFMEANEGKTLSCLDSGNYAWLNEVSAEVTALLLKDA